MQRLYTQAPTSHISVNTPRYPHSTCNHAEEQFVSDDGHSSNKLEPRLQSACFDNFIFSFRGDFLTNQIRDSYY